MAQCSQRIHPAISITSQRMKPGRLEAALEKHAIWLFNTILAGSVIALFTYKYESNAPFKYSLTYLSAPILFICFYVYLRKLPAFRARVSLLTGSLLTLVFAALIFLISGGYVLLANAWGPGQREIVLEGQIIDRSVSGARSSTSYWIKIRRAGEEVTELEVSRDEYDKLAVGPPYSEHWKVGSLGLLYR